MKTFAIATAVLACSSGALAQQQRTPEEIYKNVAPSVITLRVEKRDGTNTLGSAFLISDSGIAATAWHVVNDAIHVSARFSDGEEFDVSGLVDKDQSRDIALVRVKTFGRPQIAINAADPKVGSKAYIIGAPRGLEFSITEGLVSQIQDVRGRRQYPFSSPASPGNSGGPLLNDKGEVTGVVSWQVRDGQNLNFAVPAQYLLGLDKTLPTTPWSVIVPTRPPRSANVEEVDKLLARAFVALIDSTNAVGFQTQVFRKNGAFRNGLDAWLYSSQRELNSTANLLKDLSSSDPVRTTFGAQLLTQSELMIETIDLLAQAARTAQNAGGWSGPANDLVARAWGAMPRAFPPVENTPIWESAVFRQILPETMTKKDETGFRLGVDSAILRPRLILNVEPNSLAEQMGLKPLDVLVSIGGMPLESILALKESIKRSPGTRVKLVVARSDKHRTLDVKLTD